jgi:hypothetical protein
VFSSAFLSAVLKNQKKQKKKKENKKKQKKQKKKREKNQKQKKCEADFHFLQRLKHISNFVHS